MFFSLQKHFFPRLMLIKEQAPFSSDTPGFGSPRVPTPSFHWDLFPASECLSSDLSTACVHSWVLAELSRGELRLSRPFTDPSWVSFLCLHLRAALPRHYKGCPSKLQDAAGPPAPLCTVISPRAAAPRVPWMRRFPHSVFLETEQKQKTVLCLNPTV